MNNNSLVSGAGGLRFKSRAGEIGHKVANDLLPLEHFFEKSCVTRRLNDVEIGRAARYTLQRDTGSIPIIKDLIDFDLLISKFSNSNLWKISEQIQI